MTNNEARLAGYTVEVEAFSDHFDLSLLVKPDTDFDGIFHAYDMDNEELIKVAGWQFRTYKVYEYLGR